MELAIEQYLIKLQNDIGMANLYEKKEKGLFFLPFGKRNILLLTGGRAFMLNAAIGMLPKEEHRVESFCLYLLFANFLGQGTGHSAIGLMPDQATLSLTMKITRDIDYEDFKNTLEEFVNYFDYWKDEIEQKKIRDVK